MNAKLFPHVLAFGVGFLSLSQEILLVRLVGFAYHTTPKAFSFGLAFFLLGIALGAYIGKELCRKPGDLYRVAAITLIIAGSLDVLIPLHAWRLVDLPMALALIIWVLASGFKSILFPIAHHLGSENQGPHIGSSVSKVYFANIMGAALGPIVTGFFLLEYLTLSQCLLLTAAGTLALALACGLKARYWRSIPFAAGFAVMSLVGCWINPLLVARMISVDSAAGQSIGRIVETRSGIVHTITTLGRPDMTFGGNVYDGMINTSLRTNQNGIHRAYVLNALHPAPKRVLIIGLSSGAWTWVASRMSGVEHIDVVEINGGYLEVVRGYPQVSGILSDPRITLHIDDGRRWLRRNPASMYDLIIMNTTFHWRAYLTNLLSAEFQTIVRAHLNPGGVATYNTTDSPDAYATAAQVFPFVRKYENFVYVSDHDFVTMIPRYQSRLWQMTDGVTPVLDRASPEDVAAVNMLLNIPFRTVAEIQEAARRPLQIITDDNLLTEYKYGRNSGLVPFLD